MLGPEKRREGQLFYVGFSLDDRVPPEHPLRAVAREIDFSFVRAEVADLYGDRGNESVDPIVVLKLLFLKYFCQVDSMRELMRQLPLRLDWLWFCQFDLTDEIPDHSVISKARRRWGREVFTRFFTRVLTQCVEAGLVDGSVVHVDASVSKANASKDSIRRHFDLVGGEIYDEDDAPPPGTRVSSTDRDARLTTKNGETILGYKEHRVVDDHCGIVTATVTTPADVSEPHVLERVMRQHEFNTGIAVQTPVADKQYGTAANYRMLHDRGMTPCIPHKRPRENPDKLPRRLFVYDAAEDQYTCPAGEILTRRTKSSPARRRYGTSATVCGRCSLKTQCTDGARRLISRQDDQEVIDWADGCLPRSQRRRLMARRKAKGEGSFADATNRHGYKRHRWRGQEHAEIQNLLIATLQNIRKLIKRSRPTPQPAAAAQTPMADVATSVAAAVRRLFAVARTTHP